MVNVEKEWSWTDWENGTLELCDARESWEDGWEKIFDRVAGKKRAEARSRIHSMKLEACIHDFLLLKKRSALWDAPPVEDICTLGFGRS